MSGYWQDDRKRVVAHVDGDSGRAGCLLAVVIEYRQLGGRV